MRQDYEVIVVGGGHAGAEAAWAASRLGAEVALVTMDRRAIGRMSCNPAIGGLGKGQIVREIDALGGLMGVAADRGGIQFRMLNRKKGPAVWGPRTQADRRLFAEAIQDLLATAANIEIVEGLVESIITKPISTRDQPPSNAPPGARHRTVGVTLQDGRVLRASAVVLTTGTFLRGLMHSGETKTAGGRHGEPGANALSANLASLGLELGRLKTGTPPRVDRDTVDYGDCIAQHADEWPVPFSFLTDAITLPQITCWITFTNPAVHEHIRANLDRAPMYTGQIESTGPRYCPSIEDKVVRFADRPRHQVFLEPEGYDSDRIYCNGISTSLPPDVQDRFVRSIPGLGRSRIVQYGYAVEYDWIPTYQATISLESKLVAGLFPAGQINGTSGYEEAAAQGLVAGVNAVRRLKHDEPLVLGRDQAYIGVMIDDLITRPPSEPYRMFTSRAEYRLGLRADNADLRLTPIGRKIGLVDDDRWARFQRKVCALEAIGALAERGSVDGVALSLWMKRPEAGAAALAAALGRDGAGPFGVDDLEQVLIEARYSGYVERQTRQVERHRKLESLRIPDDIDYLRVHQLRAEARENLTRVAPQTLGQAGRIAGVNPADITVLWVHLVGRGAGRRSG